MYIDGKIIVKMIYGSHLYGTSSETSDFDVKGVFLPSKLSILLNKVKPHVTKKREKSPGEKNTPGDVDIQIFSLYKFIEHACEGQTVALDMLHAPDKMILEKSRIWDSIVKERSRFYTKSLKAFVSYAKDQAAKYGIKGSRLDSTKKFMDLLLNYDPNTKLSKFWDILPLDENIKYISNSPNGIRQVKVCDKILQETCDVKYTYPILKKFYDVHGERAKQAELNEGIDFKAVSHAVRAALEVKEMFLEGTITLPLREAELVKKIKYGKLNYKTIVAPMLEELIEECTRLSEQSNYPEEVDMQFWDDFVCNIIEESIR